MPRGPLLHNTAIEARILAVLRESPDALTARQIADGIGTVACGCETNPATAAAHRAKATLIGSCGGTGWRRTFDTDVRGRLDRLIRIKAVERVPMFGSAAMTAYYLSPLYIPDPVDFADPWADEDIGVTYARVMNDH